MAFIQLPILFISFYSYEFNNETKKFSVSNVNIVTVSFIRTSKWYKVYILINGKFTGRFLNFISANSIEYYSIKKEIGLAYKSYTLAKYLSCPNENIPSKKLIVPDSEISTINRIIKEHLIPITKFSSRDELTLLGLF